MATYTAGSIPLTEKVYSAEEVDSLLAGAVKGGVQPKGSVAFASLPEPSAANVGHMYNVTDAFTTTSAWVEGAGKNYPAHTNVYVVNPSGSTYKWDALPGEGPQPATAAPAADGTAAVGTSAKFAREDHVHPTDTTRAAAADLTSHTGNTTVHITAAERTAWNAKASTDVATTSANGLMSSTDKAKLDQIDSYIGQMGPPTNAAILTVNGAGKVASGNQAAAVTDLNVNGTTFSSVASTASSAASAASSAQTTANTASTNASAALTRLAAIESAAGTLLSNLSAAAVTDAAMTNANTIKTAVLTLIDFLKAFAAASDNDASTNHTAS